MLYSVFIAISAITAVYFLAAKRRVDIFTVSAFSACLFFFPAYVGRVDGPRGYPPLPVVDTMYAAYSFFLFFILVGAVISDLTIDRRLPTSNNALQVDRLPSQLWIMAAVAVCISVLLFYDDLLTGSKRSLVDGNHKLPFLFQIFSVPAIVLLFCQGGVLRFLGAAAICAVSLLLGQRSPIALAGIAVFLLHFSWAPQRSLLARHAFLTIVVAPAAVLMASLAKPLYAELRRGDVTSFFQRVSESFPDVMSAGAEFLRTQYIFAEIIRTEFSTDGGHILRSVFSVFPIPRRIYTTASSEFNDLFQPKLFPDIYSGLAYNPFAEFYSAWGFPGIILMSMAYVGIIMFIKYVLHRSSGLFLCTFIAISAAIIAFYVHRNSAATVFALIRNVGWPMLAIWGAAWFIRQVVVERSSNSRANQ